MLNCNIIFEGRGAAKAVVELSRLSLQHSPIKHVYYFSPVLNMNCSRLVGPQIYSVLNTAGKGSYFETPLSLVEPVTEMSEKCFHIRYIT